MQYGGYVKPQELQEGGVSSALAFLKRGKKRKEAYDEASEQERILAEKMGKGGLWGSLGSIGGGLLLPALAGAAGVASGGLALPLLAGLGAGLGKYGGSRFGYGEDFEIGDMMYGDEAGFSDIEGAGESYRGQMTQDALASAAKAALTAGFAKDGGIYGKASRFGQKTKAGLTAGGDVAAYKDLGLTAANQGAPLSIEGVAPQLQEQSFNTSLASGRSGLKIPTPDNRFLQPQDIYSSGIKPGASMPYTEAEQAFLAPEIIGDQGLDSSFLYDTDFDSMYGFSPESVPSGVERSNQLGAINSLLDSQASLDESIGTLGKFVDSPYVGELEPEITEIMGRAGALGQEVPTETGDIISSTLPHVKFGEWGANRQQYQPMINDFFQKYSPTQRNEENWKSMFNQPDQFAGLMDGGIVRRNPRTLLDFRG